MYNDEGEFIGKKGDVVTILNQNLDGKPIIEDKAVLVSFIRESWHYKATDGNIYNLVDWVVKYSDGGTATRTIYPQCDVDSVRERQ